MGQFVKGHRIIPIILTFTLLPIDNFILYLVGKNLKKRNRKWSIPKFSLIFMKQNS